MKSMVNARLDFKKIREQAQVEPVINHYGLQLVRKGDELSGLCPFHEDTKPSFRINAAKKIWRCFGCDAKGNLIELVVRMGADGRRGVSIKEAYRLVAEWCGMEGAAIVSPSGRQRPSVERKAAVSEEGSSPVRETPVATSPAASENSRQETDEQKPEEEENRPLAFSLKLDPQHPYLASRGVSPELAEAFGLGYCNRGMFAGMIAIALRNSEGQLIGYLGRWPGEPPEGKERYKFPTGFKKSRMLYHLDGVKGCETLVIVEGVWSVLRLHQLGVPAVALLGRDLSPYQEELLVQSGVRRLALMLDGNMPGREATAALLPRLARRFFVRVLDLPDEAQPDTIPEEELRALVAVLSIDMP